MKLNPFQTTLIASLCVAFFASLPGANAQTPLFIKLSTSRTPVAATATINPTAGNSFGAAAPFAGTTWNVISQSNNIPIGTPSPWDTNLYTGLVLKTPAGAASPQTLTVGYHAQTPNPSTRIEPSTSSGENTIQAGGVMQNAWRNFQTGNYSTWTISNLTANAKYGLYVYGGTTSSGQFGQFTNASGFGGINMSTANTTANSAGSFGSIWTVSGGHTNLMPQGTTWNFAVGNSDANGTFQFMHFGGGGNNEYMNGFQLVPLTAAGLTGPADQTVVAGNNTTLSATVTGFPAPLLQWQTNGVNIAGATNASLLLANVQYAQDGYVYSLIASNAVAMVTNSMTLTVIVTPGINGLNNQSVTTNMTVIMNPTVSGVPAPTLQWQFNGNNLSDGPTGNGSTITGSTGSTLTLANSQTSDSGSYSLIASNSAGIVTNSMTLTVSDMDVPPNITGPTDQTVVQTSNALFTVSVSGLPAPALQWRENGTDIPGETASTLTLANVQYSQNGYVYSLVASNSAGMATNSASLFVLVPPSITNQPASLVVTNTQSATFSVGADGVPSPVYQWRTNGIPIANATNASYVIPSASPANMAVYSVTVSNSVGVVTSTNATLTVNSTMSAATLAPANGATGICYDTPLYLTFSQAPTLRNAGTIKIFNVNNPNPVDTIDLSLNSVGGFQTRSAFPGDAQAFNYFPVIITGNLAAIYPHSGVMTSNQTYYVTVDNGVFTDASAAYFAGITDTNAWKFTTKFGGPANPANLIVATNGTGDFVTVQGAVDSVPLNNTNPTVINIRNGNYTEIVNVSGGKSKITFRGQSRFGTLVGYANNAPMAPGGTTHARMAFKVNANDIAIENMSITNRTPQGGGQAEALMIESAAKRCIVNNAEIGGRQDTILANVNSSQAFFYNTRILGNFDYIWGGGNLFFSKCVLHTISGTAGGNLTAARTDTAGSLSTNTPWVNPNGTPFSANGFSFVNCTLEADPGITGITLAGANGTAGGLDSWVFCKIDTNAYVSPSTTLSNTYVFWQNQNTFTNGVDLVSYTNVQTIGATNNDPRLLAATNIAYWFYGWQPALAPNITSQPVGATVSQGQSASFTVAATGIPDPTYQWYQNGLPVSGATSATLNLASAVRTNGGNYTVVASNGSGSVTSSVAVLTYTGNVAPVANPSTYSRPAGYPLVIPIAGNLSTYWSDADADPLALTSGISSTNGATVSYDSLSVYYTNANDVADQVNYTVGDGFGGTAAGVINVLVGAPPTNSIAGTVVNGNGTATLSFVGVPGYTYQLDATLDLTPPVVWTTISTNTADINGLWQFTDLQATNYLNRYYRSAYRP